MHGPNRRQLAFWMNFDLMWLASWPRVQDSAEVAISKVTVMQAHKYIGVEEVAER